MPQTTESRRGLHGVRPPIRSGSGPVRTPRDVVADCLSATVREQIAAGRAYKVFRLDTKNAFGEREPIVSAIPVRSPMTAAALALLDEQDYDLVTATPERYPERAFVVIGGDWVEVEVVLAPEDAQTVASDYVAPTTHVNGKLRVPPLEFDHLKRLGAACVVAAGEPDPVADAVGGGFVRSLNPDRPLRRVPPAESTRDEVFRLFHARGMQWEAHTGEVWGKTGEEGKRRSIIREVLGLPENSKVSSRTLDLDALSVLVDHLTEDLRAAGFDVDAADAAYQQRRELRERAFGGGEA